MATILHKYLDKLDDLKVKVGEDADKVILDSIDIKELIKNPRQIIGQIAVEFSQRHVDKIQQSYKVVEDATKKIIEKS
jgi:hypothetical protein